MADPSALLAHTDNPDGIEMYSRLLDRLLAEPHEPWQESLPVRATTPYTPLAAIGARLVALAGTERSIVRKLSFDPWWVTVERGDGPVEPGRQLLGAIHPALTRIVSDR